MPATTTEIETADLAAHLKQLLADRAGGPLFTRLTEFVGTVLGVPVVFMTIIDAEKQYFKHRYCSGGALQDTIETPLAKSFCRIVVDTGEPLVVPDTRLNPLTMNNRVITEDQVVAYAGVPLTHSSGARVGTLCAIDYNPRRWDSDHMTVLRAVAAQVMTELELRVVSSALDEALNRVRTGEEYHRELTRHAAHDLRTPLASLLLCLETLPALGPLNAEQQEYVQICTRATNTLRNLVDSLFDAELIAQRGAQALRRTVCRPDTLLRKALDQVVGLANEKHIELMTRVDGAVPEARLDQEKIVRLLVNLAGNALKFTSAGGRVMLRAAAHPTDPGKIVFSVEDTGVGISRENTNRVLKEGARVSDSTDHGTTGLGLIFCQRILEAHGGELTVESEPGKGSTFRAVVPLGL
jgi:signal transduction histidine kinase